MKKQLNKIILVLLVATVVCFTSCIKISEKYINTDKEQKKISEEILKCLNEDDAEAFKNMFCNKIKASENFDNQIQDAFNFFEGKIVSYDDLIRADSDGKSWIDGKLSRVSTSGRVTNVVNDETKRYSIKFYNYLICTEDKDKEGISEVTIKSNNGSECKIGDYYIVHPENQK